MLEHLRFGRRLAIPSTRQIIHEMRMLQAEEERHNTKVVHLRKDEAPSSDGGRISVVRDSLGMGTPAASIVEREGYATFHVPHGASKQAFDVVVSKAQRLAARVGLPTIYVQE